MKKNNRSPEEGQELVDFESDGEWEWEQELERQMA